MLHARRFLPALFAYLAYLGCGIVLLLAFCVLYCWVTPLDELQLIRNHGQAAALSFGGALLGFSLTLASSAWHLNTLSSFVIWAMLGLLVQIIAHLLLSRCLPDLQQALQDNNTAMGVFAGSIQLAVGLLNAGSLS
jgi:putative membrane protein